jgi:hypothetical protein
MMALCQKTKQVWEEYEQAYEAGLPEGLKDVLNWRFFKKEHKEFLLKNERYKHYKIDAPILPYKNSDLVDFIRKVPSPELIDIVSCHNKSYWYEISCLLGKLQKLNHKKAYQHLDSCFDPSKIYISKSKIRGKEFVKLVLDEMFEEEPLGSFVLCHSSMTFNHALQHFESRNGEPLDFVTLCNVREFTLNRFKLEDSDKTAEFPNLVDFLCKCFPKLAQFNIELDGCKEESMKWMKEMLDRHRLEESLHFDLSINDTTRSDMQWVKARNEIVMYFGETKQYFFKADVVKYYFRQNITDGKLSEVSKNGKFIILRKHLSFKLKNVASLPNDTPYALRILAEFRETPQDCFVVRKHGWVAMNINEFSLLPPFSFTNLLKLKLTIDWRNWTKIWLKNFNDLIDHKLMLEDSSFDGILNKNMKIFLKLTNLYAFSLDEMPNFEALNKFKIYRFETELTECVIHTMITKQKTDQALAYIREITELLLKNPNLKSFSLSDINFNLATDDDREKLMPTKNQNNPILDLIYSADEMIPFTKIVDSSFIKY